MIKLMEKTILMSLILILLLIGIVSAVPSIPHAFRGTASYTNGNPLPDGYIVTAKLDEQAISTSSVVEDGKYGYTDPLLVSDVIVNGQKVYFYVNGKLVENNPVNFVIGEVTNLNLTVDSPPPILVVCGDNICNGGETCSTCPGDCGTCSTGGNTGGSSSSGGGSSCIENWRCGDWGECENGLQTRTCEDINRCGTKKSKPYLQRTCDVEGEAGEGTETMTGEEPGIISRITGAVIGGGTARIVIPIIFIILIAWAVITVYIKRKATEEITSEGVEEVVEGGGEE